MQFNLRRLFGRLRPNINKTPQNADKYQALIKYAGDSIFITDSNYLITDVNEMACGLVNYSREELLRLKIHELMTAEEQKLFATRTKIIEKEGGSLHERTLKRKDGSLVETEVNVRPVKGVGYIAIIRDITVRKRIERKLVESEIRFREVLENSIAAPYKRNLQTNTYEYLSPVYQKIAGYTQEEMNTLPLETVLEMMHPDDIQIVKDGLNRALNGPGGIGNTLEYRLKNKSTGEYRWLRDEFVVMQDAQGKVVSLIGSVSDITERKRIERELIESKEQMALFVEHSPAALAMLDDEMRYIATSRRWMTAYNLGDQRIVGRSHYEIFPEIEQDWKDIHQRCLKGAIERRDEDSFTRLDGTTDWLKWEIRPWHKASGKIGGIIMFTEVITEQKESELKFKNLVEKSPVGVYILRKGRLVYVNPAYCRCLGYTEEELLALEEANQLVYGKDMAIAIENRRKRRDDGVIDIHSELRFQRKDGEIIWAEVNSTQTLYKGSMAVIGTFQDITERKKATELFKHQFENSPDIILIINKDLKVDSINKDQPDGFKVNEIIGRYSLDLLPEESRGPAKEMLDKCFGTGQNQEHEILIYFNRWVRSRYVPIRIDDVISHVMVIGTDITERKKAEESIRQSEANYRQLFDNSPLPMWVIDEKTSAIIQVNQACIKNYGYREEELLAMKITDISPGEPGLAVGTSMDGLHFMGSHRHQKKSGEFIDVVTSSIPISLAGENKILMTAIDVTEKNLYEQKLAKAAIKAQEEERYEIGGELHDNVCQILSGSLMYLGLMKKNLQPESDELYNQTHDSIKVAADEIRNLTHRLAPAYINQAELQDAFLQLLNSFNAGKNYEISLQVDEVVRNYPLDRDLLMNLYRVLQEQLRNILKHANAKKINVEVSIKKGNVLEMIITDDGVGFDPKTVKGGIGLANMSRRVQLFSGTFTIESAPGDGCKIIVGIPLSGTN